MSSRQKVATVFGGTGFIGRQIVRELAAQNVLVKVATRVPERGFFLKTCGTVGQVTPVACDYSDAKSVAEAVKGSDYVVNCIGILFEKGKKRTFKAVHTELPQVIAKACKKAAVKRFVHISALGCDSASSRYAQSKLAGEKLLLKAFPKATVLRPSVVFGEDDNFFNMFAGLARILPVLPLIGGGKTKFQPVFVGDVADAVMAALTLSAVSADSPQGKIYELGGPNVVSFKEIYGLLFEHTGRSRALVPLPFWVAKVEASFLSLMPTPLLTRDQVESLKSDTVVADGALRFKDLGIAPKAMAQILPTYLERYRPGGRFGDKKAA